MKKFQNLLFLAAGLILGAAFAGYIAARNYKRLTKEQKARSRQEKLQSY